MIEKDKTMIVIIFFSVFLDNDSISWVNAFLTEIGDYEAKENNTP
jgi:hypothetical protein